jgi:hypothetical protein
MIRPLLKRILYATDLSNNVKAAAHYALSLTPFG